MNNEGLSCVFTFPYWLYVDPNDLPTTTEVVLTDARVRFYPPFRNAPWDFTYHSRLEDRFIIPFSPGQRPDYSQFHVTPPPIPITYFHKNGETNVQFFAKNKSMQGSTPPQHLLPKDAIRIDIYSEDPNESGLSYLANGIIERLMTFLRWRSRQWWITRSIQGFVEFRDVSFPVSSDGRFLKKKDPPWSTSGAHALRGHEKYIDDNVWRLAISDLRTKAEVPMQEVLLLDADYFVSVKDLRQAVISADGACEQVKEKVFEQLWLSRNPGKSYDETRRNDLLRSWDMPRQIDSKFDNHFNRSYRVEHPSEWSTVNQLWTARNNVAHGGRNEYGNPTIQVDELTCISFIVAATHCIRWLESLT